MNSFAAEILDHPDCLNGRDPIELAITLVLLQWARLMELMELMDESPTESPVYSLIDPEIDDDGDKNRSETQPLSTP